MKRSVALSVQVPSKPGVLAEIIRSFEEEGVKIMALSAPDAVSTGIIRLLVDDLKKAQDVLNHLHYPFSVDEVFVFYADRWEEVRNLIMQLGIAKINIEFCFSSDGKTYVLGTDQVEKTEQLFQR